MPTNTITGQYTICPGCGREIDPKNHTRNVKSDTKYCSIDCYTHHEL